MITPILERLLLTGRAIKYNKVHGLSGAGWIDCPKNRWVVITDIWFYPFQDAAAPDKQETLKQLNLMSANRQEQQNYVFKNNCFVPFIGGATADGGVIHMDVFDVFKDDVVITIVKSTALGAGGIDYIPVDAQSQQNLPPVGYGISTKVVKRSVDGAGTEIVPAGVKNFVGLVPSQRASTDFRFDAVINKSQLLQPTDNTMIPLINMTIVIVNSSDVQNN